MTYVLLNIMTEVHWQLACEAAKHAVKGKKIELVCGTPDGDVALKVQRKGAQVTIRRM